MAQTNTDVSQLKFNRMTSAKYLELKQAGLLKDDEFYITPDDITDGAALPLFFSTWADHKLTDISWLRADTFSWQSGAVYVAAYNELERENSGRLDGTTYYGWTNEDSEFIVYTTSAIPQPGDLVYNNQFEVIQNGSLGPVDVESGATADVFYYSDYSETYYCTRNSAIDTTAGESNTTTDENGITYFLSSKEYKIALPDQEQKILELYNNTGIAWYYILDTTNKRFKLPRVANPTLYYQQVPVIGNGIAIGVTDGTNEGTISRVNGSDRIWLNTGVGENVGNAPSSTTSQLVVDRLLGLSEDPNNSGIIADMTQSNSPKGHLYFFVGNYEQTAIQQTAGVNAEMFNEKADISFVENKFKIVSSLPETVDIGTFYFIPEE